MSEVPLRFQYSFAIVFLLFFSVFQALNAKDMRSYTGLGSSFVAPAVQELADNYFKKTGVRINYQSFGSGAGLKQVSLGIVDFGFIDMPQSKNYLEKAKLVQFPLISGHIVPIANIPDIKAAQVFIDENSFYKIFTDQIHFWDDECLKKLNPKLSLPHTKIRVIVRSDSSGTTYNFSSFLASVNKSFRRYFAVSTQLAWPQHFVKVKGNEGVSSIVSQIPGAIGYVDHTYTIQKSLAPIFPIKLSSKAKKVVMIPAKSYVILKKVHLKEAKYKNLMSFFLWVINNGNSILNNMRYKVIDNDDFKYLSFFRSLHDFSKNSLLLLGEDSL